MPLRKNSRKYGLLAEDFAEGLLKKKGYKIIERNYSTKFSEIDIIALKEDTLVFVEVKARWGRKYGLPIEAVTSRKLAKIMRAGEIYSIKHKNLPKKLRVDVVAIEINEGKITDASIIEIL